MSSGLTYDQLNEEFDALNREVALDWCKRHGYMTGQEWYDRLLLRVDQNRYYHTDPEYEAQQDVLKAARIAAGLEEG